MPKIVYFIPLILAIILGFIIYDRYMSSKPQSNLPVIKLKIKEAEYNIEIASTTSQKAKGLSGRPSLCANCGMIFVFGQMGSYPFWMKDTLIPLDMIWLDQNGKVVTILTATPQPSTSMFNLKNYYNTSPAMYVIELNANDSQKINLKVGDIIDLSPLNASKI